MQAINLSGHLLTYIIFAIVYMLVPAGTNRTGTILQLICKSSTILFGDHNMHTSNMDSDIHVQESPISPIYKSSIFWVKEGNFLKKEFQDSGINCVRTTVWCTSHI